MEITKNSYYRRAESDPCHQAIPNFKIVHQKWNKIFE